jgi:hypothetical protein
VIFLDSGNQARTLKKPEVMGQRGGVTRILQLAEHLLKGEDLPGPTVSKFTQHIEQISRRR